LSRLRRENKQLKREILSKAAAWLAREAKVRKRAPGHVSDRHDVPDAGCLRQWVLCVVVAGILGARSDEALVERLSGFHGASRGTYESPRIHADLAASGNTVGRKRVARLMKNANLRGVSRPGAS
jgi:hypothetical protein